MNGITPQMGAGTNLSEYATYDSYGKGQGIAFGPFYFGADYSRMISALAAGATRRSIFGPST
jgi:hypothetical protein